MTGNTSEVDEKVLALLGNRATPLYNPFDSDGTYGITCLSSKLHFCIFL